MNRIRSLDRTLAMLALGAAIFGIFLALAIKSTPCAGAQSASCPVAGSRLISSGLTVNDDQTTQAQGGDFTVKSAISAAAITMDADTGDVTLAAKLLLTDKLDLSEGGTNASLTAVAGALAFSNSSGFAFTATGTTGQCALSAGGGTPTFGDCYRPGGTDVALADGGTGSSLVATNGAVVYGGPSGMQFTAVGSVGECLMSLGATTPAWASCATAGGGVDIQEFTATGTWTKPAGAELVYVILFGAGGGGEKGLTSSGTANGSTGGGGGARCEMMFDADDLAATETVNVPGGGPGGSGASGDDGITGGNSSFGSWITCYGGAGGNALGAGGGGCAGAGGAPTGGEPNPFLTAAIVDNVDCGGASAMAGGDTNTGGNAQNGGGGGGPLNTSAGANAGNNGGGSLFGGAGGAGGGGCASVGDATAAGGIGGANGAYSAGTGVAGGTAPGGAGNPGASGSQGGGGGSGGGSGAGAIVGGVGGAGGVPGGGGGGGGSGCDSLSPGDGGAGGRGEVRVYSFG